MQKILSIGLISLTALATLTPFAQADNNGRRLMGSGSTGSGKTLNLTCAHDAVVAREDAIQSAYLNLSSALIQALGTRGKELDSAWSIENRDNRKVAREAAWSNWAMSSKAARDAFRTSRRTAWDTFRSSMKACNVPTNEIDNSKIQAQDVQ